MYIFVVVRALDCTFKPPLSLPVKNKSEGLSDAALGGIIIGTIMFAALCTVLIVVLARRKPTPTLGTYENNTIRYPAGLFIYQIEPSDILHVYIYQIEPSDILQVYIATK